MRRLYDEKKFCYFAVDLLATKEFIGFIGLSVPTLKAFFTPCIDLGWRLDKRYWHNGYATEGAKASIAYACDELKLSKVVAVCPVVNTPSEAVMVKAGMQKAGTFLHPLLENHPHIRECVLYKISNS